LTKRIAILKSEIYPPNYVNRNFSKFAMYKMIIIIDLKFINS